MQEKGVRERLGFSHRSNGIARRRILRGGTGLQSQISIHCRPQCWGSCFTRASANVCRYHSGRAGEWADS
jgi:hypothetical protein